MTRGMITPVGGQKPEARRLVDRLPVQRVVDGQAQPPVAPRRLRVPLLGELEPRDRRVLRRHQLHPRIALDVLRVRAVERVGDVGLAVLSIAARVETSGTLFMTSRLTCGTCAASSRGTPRARPPRRACGSRTCTGPAPIGCLRKPSSPTWVTYFFGTTMPAAVAVVPYNVMKSGHGSLSTNRTVSGSTTSTWRTRVWNSLAPVPRSARS